MIDEFVLIIYLILLYLVVVIIEIIFQEFHHYFVLISGLFSIGALCKHRNRIDHQTTLKILFFYFLFSDRVCDLIYKTKYSFESNILIIIIWKNHYYYYLEKLGTLTG